MILSKGELVAVYTPLFFLRADILRNLYLSVLQSYSFEVKHQHIVDLLNQWNTR